MKKTGLLLLLLCGQAIFAQQLTYEDFKTILPFLKNEDFKGAFNTSQALLRTTDADTSDIRAQVSYINIYAAAGMVTLEQMTHRDFWKTVSGFVGKKLKMPGHPCLDSVAKAPFNSFQFKREEKTKKLQGYTMTANKERVNILLFEYYDFEEKYNPEDFIGDTVRCGGILESFEINPNQSTVWIGRLHIGSAIVRKFLPR